MEIAIINSAITITPVLSKTAIVVDDVVDEDDDDVDDDDEDVVCDRIPFIALNEICVMRDEAHTHRCIYCAVRAE